MTTVLTLRVQRVRHRSNNSTTVSGLAIDAQGKVVANAPRYAVTFPSRLTPLEVQLGQWWRVRGNAKLAEYTVDGYHIIEHRLFAEEVALLRPSGEHIIQLLSASPAFPGIGAVKARRLWEGLGESLYDCLDNADHHTLANVIGEDLADILLRGWREYGKADALRWFQNFGLDLRLSRKILDVYGGEALNALNADPYRLLAFGMSWSALDQLAQQHFGVALDDERRLIAAVEAVLYRAFDAGDTCCERETVMKGLDRLLDRSVASSALVLAEQRHSVRIVGNRIHALGPYLIEQSVAKALRQRLGNTVPLTVPAEVDILLARFEQDEATALRLPGFALNQAQREAVHAAVEYPLVLITGGAGVGKTTVLKAVCHVLEHCGQHLYAMALSGRAAKRLTEATHRPAMTIAGFLRNVRMAELAENSVLLVDEASMLDVVLAHRLLKTMPDSSRLILIGDPSQLPPVGPGLTLHAMVLVEHVPRVELTQVQRFGGAIASGAHAVRDGRWPTLPPDAALAFLPCEPSYVADIVLRHYLADPLNTQILTFTRERGVASAKVLNAMCQGVLAASARRLLVWNAELDRQEDSGLREGEPVLCTRNLWAWGIQNGSLGRVETVEEVPQPVFDSEGQLVGTALAWIRWDDGERRPVTEEVLDALELGYAVTVHKAQGSQFPRVIVPVCAARYLDRTMLYTAITRATTQVVLVGDVAMARQAVEARPHAARRQVALAEMLEGPR